MSYMLSFSDETFSRGERRSIGMLGGCKFVSSTRFRETGFTLVVTCRFRMLSVARGPGSRRRQSM